MTTNTSLLCGEVLTLPVGATGSRQCIIANEARLWPSAAGDNLVAHRDTTDGERQIFSSKATKSHSLLSAGNLRRQARWKIGNFISLSIDSSGDSYWAALKESSSIPLWEKARSSWLDRAASLPVFGKGSGIKVLVWTNQMSKGGANTGHETEPQEHFAFLRVEALYQSAVRIMGQYYDTWASNMRLGSSNVAGTLLFLVRRRTLIREVLRLAHALRSELEDF
jgi:hypothetical protein